MYTSGGRPPQRNDALQNRYANEVEREKVIDRDQLSSYAWKNIRSLTVVGTQSVLFCTARQQVSNLGSSICTRISKRREGDKIWLAAMYGPSGTAVLAVCWFTWWFDASDRIPEPLLQCRGWMSKIDALDLHRTIFCFPILRIREAHDVAGDQLQSTNEAEQNKSSA